MPVDDGGHILAAALSEAQRQAGWASDRQASGCCKDAATLPQPGTTRHHFRKRLKACLKIDHQKDFMFGTPKQALLSHTANEHT